MDDNETCFVTICSNKQSIYDYSKHVYLFITYLKLLSDESWIYGIFTTK